MKMKKEMASPRTSWRMLLARIISIYTHKDGIQIGAAPHTQIYSILVVPNQQRQTN